MNSVFMDNENLIKRIKNKKNFKKSAKQIELIEKSFGSTKGAKSFERNRNDRF